MTASNRLLAGVVAALTLALVATVAIKLTEPLPDRVIPLTAEGPCDLQQGACSARLPGGGKLVFSIEPRPIPVLKPLQIKVQMDGQPARAVEVQFNGTTMNMGVNQAVLQPKGLGQFVGQATLPVCIRDRMDWQATVVVTTADAKLSIPFLFETVHQ